MKKLIRPGSGVDDMGGGIAEGCGKWLGIATVAFFILMLILKWRKII